MSFVLKCHILRPIIGVKLKYQNNIYRKTSDTVPRRYPTFNIFCAIFRPLIMCSMNFSDHPTFLTILNNSWQFLSFSGLKKPKTLIISQEMIMERWTVVTLNGHERLGTFESGRSNVLEGIVENVHTSKTKETLN